MAKGIQSSVGGGWVCNTTPHQAPPPRRASGSDAAVGSAAADTNYPKRSRSFQTSPNHVAKTNNNQWQSLRRIPNPVDVNKNVTVHRGVLCISTLKVYQ